MGLLLLLHDSIRDHRRLPDVFHRPPAQLEKRRGALSVAAGKNFRCDFVTTKSLTRARGSVSIRRDFGMRRPMNFSSLIFDHANLLVALCLAAVIFQYFRNNPLKHSRWFMLRRFINWFPLGMTYSFLYMGRYNLNVSKNALGSLMTKEEFGTIFAIGTTVYAFSFLINGPLVDKIGGKKGILIAAIGSSVANVLLGVLTYLTVMGKLHMNMVVAYSTLYAVNMYFQSYGAVSIIKVKAYWFHVRERGVFGAIFGALISIGGWFQNLLQTIFASNVKVGGKLVDATWAVFFIPSAIMIVWVLIDLWLIKDTPEEANFPAFDTADASSGQMHVELSTLDLLKKVFASKLM